MPATPAMPQHLQATSEEPLKSLPTMIDSKPARGRHGVGYAFENKCTENFAYVTCKFCTQFS